MSRVKKKRRKRYLFSVVSSSRERVRSQIAISRLEGWTPVSVNMRGKIPLISWGQLENTSLSQPFFKRLQRQFVRTDAMTITSKVDALEGLHTEHPGLIPGGFIFHISHCASTLLNNVLGAVPRNLAISEPQPLDDIIRALNFPHKKRLTWFRAMASALGQRRLGSEENYFIKLNSWAVLSHSFIRTAYPNARWVCMYRDPVEVMVSQLRRKFLNFYYLEEQPFTNLLLERRVSMSLVEAMARTLGRYYRIYLAMAGPNVLMVNYSQLSDQTYSQILRHLGLTVNDDEWRAMLAESKIYSKSQDRKQVFKDDTVEKQREASPHVRKMAETWAMAPYHRLEEYRLAGKLLRTRVRISSILPREGRRRDILRTMNL